MASIPENTPGKKKLGRPPRAEKFGGHIASAEQKIADVLPDLVDNLLKLAHGVRVSEEQEDGYDVVYRKAPCRQSNEYLLNRIMGKPTENATYQVEERRIIVERRDQRTGRFAVETPHGSGNGQE